MGITGLFHGADYDDCGLVVVWPHVGRYRIAGIDAELSRNQCAGVVVVEYINSNRIAASCASGSIAEQR